MPVPPQRRAGEGASSGLRYPWGGGGGARAGERRGRRRRRDETGCRPAGTELAETSHEAARGGHDCWGDAGERWGRGVNGVGFARRLGGRLSLGRARVCKRRRRRNSFFIGSAAARDYGLTRACMLLGGGAGERGSYRGRERCSRRDDRPGPGSREGNNTGGIQARGGRSQYAGVINRPTKRLTNKKKLYHGSPSHTQVPTRPGRETNSAPR